MAPNGCPLVTGRAECQETDFRRVFEETIRIWICLVIIDDFGVRGVFGGVRRDQQVALGNSAGLHLDQYAMGPIAPAASF